jgi:hypothetical protein
MPLDNPSASSSSLWVIALIAHFFLRVQVAFGCRHRRGRGSESSITVVPPRILRRLRPAATQEKWCNDKGRNFYGALQMMRQLNQRLFGNLAVEEGPRAGMASIGRSQRGWVALCRLVGLLAFSYRQTSQAHGAPGDLFMSGARPGLSSAG